MGDSGIARVHDLTFHNLRLPTCVMLAGMHIKNISTKRLRAMLAATERAAGSGSRSAAILRVELASRRNRRKLPKGVARG